MRELSFKEWLENTVNQKTRLVIYDFDGTVANVPERPQPHEPKHGWDGRDWWGSEASLSAPHFEGHVNQEVLASFKRDKADPNTDVALLTGRRGVIAHKVRELLRNHEIYGKRMIPDSNKSERQSFRNRISAGKDQEHPAENLPDAHQEFFSGDHITEPDYPTMQGKKKLVPDPSTLAFKQYVTRKLIHNNLTTIEFWDDRKDHIDNFKAMARELYQTCENLQHVWIHQVFPPAVKGAEASVIHYEVTPQTAWKRHG